MDTLTDGSFIVDSQEARELAIQLMTLTGRGLSDIVTGALRTELEHQRREHEVEARVKRVMAMAGEIRARLHGPYGSDTSDFYDGNGFPV